MLTLLALAAAVTAAALAVALAVAAARAAAGPPGPRRHAPACRGDEVCGCPGDA
ncbi:MULTISPECIES: hypothetical protein [Cellulomonas]|uniref:hypothetical protein n=1 Tax=Cellulomonas TaxID=1707 RepID=UPI0014562A8A|nr:MULTISPECIES: hypothetical protein [Cellulomonas]